MVGLLGALLVPYSFKKLKEKDEEKKPLLEGQAKQEPLSGIAFFRALFSAPESWLVIRKLVSL
jgi:hypothetical protein